MVVSLEPDCPPCALLLPPLPEVLSPPVPELPEDPAVSAGPGGGLSVEPPQAATNIPTPRIVITFMGAPREKEQRMVTYHT
jgi:hypothetical protein